MTETARPLQSRGSSDYARIERAIRFLEEHRSEQPALSDVADYLGLSEFHFQRLFQRWAGVSPKRFLQFQTLQEAKRLLRDSQSVLEAALGSGLSSASRLHDLFVAFESMTPGEFREGITLSWGVHDTPFGEAMFCAAERGLCALNFVDSDGVEAALASVQARWPDAKLVENPLTTSRYADELRHRVVGGAPRPLPLFVRGTQFQLKVWEALIRIPPGAVATYGALSKAIGQPGSARAVGSAVGDNPIAWLIPCHRVIQSTGQLGGYMWGLERKRAMLALEHARAAGT